MIHLLEVGPELTPKVLSKLARRYAMTGGYELALKPNLSNAELEQIRSTYISELASYQGTSIERKCCNASRILTLIDEASC